MERDSVYIKSNVQWQTDGTAIVKKATRLEVPAFFRDKGLYKPVDSTHVLVYGSWAIVMGEKYAIGVVPSLVSVVLSQEESMIKDDMEYITLSYEKGDTIFYPPNTIEDKLNFLALFENYLLRGKIPWFLDYDSVLDVIRNGAKYSGVNLEKRLETLEYINSEVHRSKDDVEVRLRHLQKKNPKKARYVSLGNVHYGALTALTKVTGSYQSAGLDSALITTTKKTSAAERILRNLD